MPPTERDHFATITTPRGSVVHFPFLTEEQAQDIADQYGPTAEPAPQVVVGEKRTCSRCHGAGGWNENVTVKTPSGGEVVTQKWVNCRPCGGTGQVPK